MDDVESLVYTLAFLATVVKDHSGVAQAVGPSRWAELSDAYNTLAKCDHWKVRRSLSHSH